MNLKFLLSTLVSGSLIFSVPCYGSWDMFLSGAIGYGLGRLSSLQRTENTINIDITSLNETLVNQFNETRTELRGISEAILHTGSTSANAQGFIMLPAGIKFSNSTTGIKLTDAYEVLNEFLEAQSVKLEQLNLGYKDLLILLDQIDVRELVFKTTAFKDASEELARLNGQDRLLTGDPHVNLLAVFVAYGQFKEALEKRSSEKKVIDPVRDAGQTFFHITLQRAFAKVFEANARELEREQRIEYIDAVSKRINYIALSYNPVEAAQQLRTLMLSSHILVSAEAIENVILASVRGTGKSYESSAAYEAEVKKLDDMMSRLYSQRVISEIESALSFHRGQAYTTSTHKQIAEREIKNYRSNQLVERPKSVIQSTQLFGGISGIYTIAVLGGLFGAGEFLETMRSLPGKILSFEPFTVMSVFIALMAAASVPILILASRAIKRRHANFRGTPEQIAELNLRQEDLARSKRLQTISETAISRAQSALRGPQMCLSFL